MQTLRGRLDQNRLSAGLDRKQLQAVFHMRAVRGGEKKHYQVYFQPADFVTELKRYRLTIPHEVHGLGERYLVSKITRSEDGA